MRQQNHAPYLALLAAALTLCLPPAAGAADADLPAQARTVQFDDATSVGVAAMALGGTAFFQVTTTNEVSIVHLNKEWLTLDSLPLPRGEWMLADRMGSVRQVRLLRDEQNRISGAEELASWTAEGIPTAMAQYEGRLYVAGGGAGVSAWSWDTGSRTPRLRARYPFVDYSKHLIITPEGIAFVADNFDTGLQVLNITDLEKPRHITTVSGGFYDAVAVHGRNVVTANRREGARLYSYDAANGTIHLVSKLRPLPARGKPTEVKRVTFSKNGLLLMAEGQAGAQIVMLLGHTRKGQPMAAPVWQTTTEGIVDGVFLGETQVLLSTTAPSLTVQRIQ